MKADPFCGKSTTAENAVAPIRSGSRVLVGSGAAEPQRLVEALAARAPQLADTEVLHLLTLGAAPYVSPQLQGSFRHNALFIGPNVREAVQSGRADYTPCFLHEIPRLIRSGRLPVDAALIQVAPPRDGACSLGVSVDILKAAVESARHVVAQVNPAMPWTLGDSLVRVEDIDAFVQHEEPLLELPEPPPTAASVWIGRYVSRLVSDGDTLQLGIGAIPDAVLAALAGKKDLGVHSEMISDGVLRLIEKGVVTGKRKTLHPGKVVVSFCLGPRRLYRALADNPVFELRPSDYVNSPAVIARNDRMVSINSALAVDLTGQVGADSFDGRLYSGFGGQVDFIRGAAASEGGRSIIALPSTAKDGKISRIAACLGPGTGVVTTRADVDFIVTEYGIASLKGKTLRERAVAMILLAHPRFREGLAAEAERIGLLDRGHVLPPDSGAYRADLETRARVGDVELLIRPLKPTDARRLKEMFYTQSERTTYLRFGIPLRRLPDRQLQELVAIDYRGTMAIGAFAREKGRERLVAVARYYAVPGEDTPEAAFTVHDDFQGRGLGSFMVDYLAWIAQSQGLAGFRAEVMRVNLRMRRTLRRVFREAEERSLAPDGVEVKVLFSNRRTAGRPAALVERA